MNPFQAMIHHPLDYALETSQTVLLPQQQETFVAVNPTDLRCSDQVLLLPESQRNCINPADHGSDIPYRQSTCFLSCMRDAIHKTCECHPFHLPEKIVYGRTKHIRECSAIDGYCLEDNYGGLSSYLLCPDDVLTQPSPCSQVQNDPMRLPAPLQRCLV